jgi:hypothetical protein
MGVKTTVAALAYNPSHIAAAANAGQSVAGTHALVLLHLVELNKALTTLVGSMQSGDSNIATINAQIAALQ